MKKKNLIYVLVYLLIFFCNFIYSQTVSPVQSNKRPFNLDIVGLVNLAGSDSQSVDFQTNALPSMISFINQNLGERVEIGDTSGMLLDPSKLNLTTASDVRVYFIGEGAGYHNTLGFNTNGDLISSGDPQLIFPDASSPGSYLSDGTSSGNTTTNLPLNPGDFVDIGSFDANTELDFFLIANGANGGSNVYSTQESQNPDGINHVIAYAVEDSPYLMIGFEDLYNGGDKDFNDLLFAVDIGASNVSSLSNLSGAPEPSTLLIIFIFTVILIYIKKKNI